MDSAAALLIAIVAIKEGRESWRAARAAATSAKSP
jgi:hypothetical protein